MFLEAIERRQRKLMNALSNPTVREATRMALDDLRERTTPKNVAGKTIGVIVPDPLRARLFALKDKLEIETYRQIVLMAIEIGVISLELLCERPK